MHNHHRKDCFAVDKRFEEHTANIHKLLVAVEDINKRIDDIKWMVVLAFGVLSIVISAVVGLS